MGNLIRSNDGEKLTKVVNMIKELSTLKKYRYQDNLSAAENSRLEAESKEMVKHTTKQTAHKLASVCSRYGEAEHVHCILCRPNLSLMST